MNFVTIVLSLAALSTTISVHAYEDVERSYLELGCLDIYDKTMLARMEFVCEECFRKSDQITSCSICRRCYQRQQGKSPGAHHSLENCPCTKHNLEGKGPLVYIGDPQGSRARFPA
ncbi:ion transport peptide-like [Trichonephila clavipes]|nr:ion transport peptide-like [Trichonephila clavipes]